MSWWQWLLIVVAVGILGVVGMQIPSLLRYRRGDRRSAVRAEAGLTARATGSTVDFEQEVADVSRDSR